MEVKAVRTDELQLMEHCIGYTHKRVKSGKYIAFRNYFTTNRPDNSWEKLCRYGYAQGEHFNGGGSPLAMMYSVTRAGMDFMQGVLGVKIVEEDKKNGMDKY